MKLSLEARNDNPAGCRPVLIIDGDRAEVWDESGERELAKRADGAGIEAVGRTGLNYIFTESDSAENPKAKLRMRWDFEVVSSEAERVLAKIQIGNFPVIEVPVSFAESQAVGGIDAGSGSDPLSLRRK